MLDFLYTAISWVLLRWHQLFTAVGLDPKGGLNWALSIVFLVVTVRVLLFRFFLKQVHYQRHMMEMQPKIKKLQEKYKGDRAALNREMMKLQQEEGFNPLSGCLPMFLQIPVFISLFHVLKHLANATTVPNYPESKLTLYTFTATQTHDAGAAKLFGAPLSSAAFRAAGEVTKLGGDLGAARTTTLILVIVSAVSTFITQRTVMANQVTKPEGQAALIQKLALYGIPVSVVFSGFIFPLGVLLYWFTSNLWTMGQQFYIHRFHPYEPGAAGAKAAAAGAGTATSTAVLAPKPGAKPVRPGKGSATGARPASAATPPANKAATGNTAAGNAASNKAPVSMTKSGAGDTGPGANKPRPGQRPVQKKKRR